MALLELQYKDLLTPIKNPEDSFKVDLPSLLFQFVSDLINGKDSHNFNSAALIIQGSASVYGKKVEYLHNLATNLHNSLLKQKKSDGDQPENQSAKKDTSKAKQKKGDKFDDHLVSIDIKRGKNLSCLKKKNNSKSALKRATATSKRLKYSSARIHLLIHDNDDKGDVFYDTIGEIVGNKGDFAMNVCRLLTSAWLVLPTINPNIIPSSNNVSDFDDDFGSPENDCFETGDDFDHIPESPDDGFDSCPQSSNQPDTPEADEAVPDSQEISAKSSNDIPNSVDEGIGNTPNLDDSPGAENVPLDDGEDVPQAPQPVRQSVRHALKTCQLAIEDDPLAGISINKELLKKRAIEKKNVRCLPKKLKENGSESPDEPISLFCSRTFFYTQVKAVNCSVLMYDTQSFDQNSNFMRRIIEKLDALKTSDRKNKNIAPIEDEKVDVEGPEVSRDANEDDETLCVPFDDNDIHIDHDHMGSVDNTPKVPLPEDAHVDQASAPDMPPEALDISHIAQEENENYIREVYQFVHTSDITQRVHEWEKNVKPFLKSLDTRRSFDINLYGSQLLNSFEDNNRKQTKTFRELCKGKEKWEIHRYFMALLPLANIGNVELGKEIKSDGTEEIFVTLLSRKMHHIELEEFGHNEGEHS